jgi:hypothetical protein
MSSFDVKNGRVVMKWVSLAVAGLIAVGLGGYACKMADNTPLSATTNNVTDTYSDSITTGGIKTYPFVVKAAGTVTVTLTAVAPVATLSLGMNLGTWDGVAVCTAALTNTDMRVTSTPMSGTANSAFNACVQVYDSGNVTGPVTYTFTVNHP